MGYQKRPITQSNSEGPSFLRSSCRRLPYLPTRPRLILRRFLIKIHAETDVIFELTPSELVYKLLRKDSYKLRHTRVKSKACFIFFAIWSKKGRYTEIGAEFGAEFGANLEFGSV